MREVKEKQHMKAPKTHDPTRRMPRRAQKAYGKINEVIPTGEDQYQSPDDYAVQKSEEYTQETADRAYHGAKKTVQKTKDEVLKSYAGVCLQGAVIIISCIVYSVLADTPAVNASGDATTMVWSWLLQTIFFFLVLVGAVKMSDRVVKEMIGF